MRKLYNVNKKRSQGVLAGDRFRILELIAGNIAKQVFVQEYDQTISCTDILKPTDILLEFPHNNLFGMYLKYETLNTYASVTRNILTRSIFSGCLSSSI